MGNGDKGGAGMTVAETIKEITRKHLLEHHGVALGQCLTAVGWVGGTVPELTEEQGLIELSMADVSGGYIAVGLALAGRRPIYIVRYQGFQWFNCPGVINYAAKAKDMWGYSCPMFVRSIAMDGAIGPVASGSHHSLFARMPGIAVAAPMTPNEYRQVWDYFTAHDEVVYASEHRRSFGIDYEMHNIIRPDSDITLFAISSTRLEAMKAAKRLWEEGRIRCNLIHLLWLKPFLVTDVMRKSLADSSFGGLIIDGDFENGTAKHIAFDLMQQTGKTMHVLGLEERAAGFAEQCDNLPPTAEKIYAHVKRIVKK